MELRMALVDGFVTGFDFKSEDMFVCEDTLCDLVSTRYWEAFFSIFGCDFGHHVEWTICHFDVNHHLRASCCMC